MIRISLFVYALAFSLFVTAPVTAAVPTADEITAVEKDIKDAEADAKNNAPENGRVKKMEDDLDAAARKLDDLPANASEKARKDAEDNVKQARESADILRDQPRVRDTDDVEKAKNYREALEKRRQARKKLKTWQSELLKGIQGMRQAGVTGPEAAREYTQLKRRVDTALRQVDRTFQVASTAPAQPAKGAHTTSSSAAKSARTKAASPPLQPSGRPDGALH